MVGTTECFKIRLSCVCSSVISKPWENVGEQETILEIPYERKFFSHNPIIIVADPFLFTHRGELFLFYEEKRLCSPGVLRMTKTVDLKKWTKPVTVLEEPFHLSYPYVFENNGEVYMIPETSAIGEVRLYKAEDDGLLHFNFHSVLLSRREKNTSITIDFSDSSVYLKDGVYYLVSSVKMDDVNHLFLYISDKLTGPYRAHPCSPLCVSMKYGRDAGCFLTLGDKLYRFAQDCEERYGDNIHIFEISNLTKDNYKETLVYEKILKKTDAFYSKGGHQLNFVEFRGKRIVATDAKEYRYFLKHLLDRIFSKI